jgi:hypothetical protein
MDTLYLCPCCQRSYPETDMAVIQASCAHICVLCLDWQDWERWKFEQDNRLQALEIAYYESQPDE